MNNSYLKTLVLFFLKTFHLSSLFVLPSSVCVRVQKKHAFKQNQEEYKNPSFQARYNFRSEGGEKHIFMEIYFIVRVMYVW